MTMACSAYKSEQEFTDAKKWLIRMADSYEEADGYVVDFFTEENNGKIPSYMERLDYVYGKFDNVRVVASKFNSDNSEQIARKDYIAVINAIINQKWR